MANIARQGVSGFSERGRPSSAFLSGLGGQLHRQNTSHDLQVSEHQAYGMPFDCAIYPDNVQGLPAGAQMPKVTDFAEYLYQDFSVVPSDTVVYNEADLPIPDLFLRADIGTQSFQAVSEPSLSLYASEYEASILGRHMPPAATFSADQATTPPNVPIPALAHRIRHLQQERLPTSNSAQPCASGLNCTQPGCNKTFGRPAEFRRHLRTVHQRQDASDYRCLIPSCGYAYPRPDKVRSHMEKIHGLRLERVNRAGKANAKEIDKE